MGFGFLTVFFEQLELITKSNFGGISNSSTLLLTMHACMQRLLSLLCHPAPNCLEVASNNVHSLYFFYAQWLQSSLAGDSWPPSHGWSFAGYHTLSLNVPGCPWLSFVCLTVIKTHMDLRKKHCFLLSLEVFCAYPLPNNICLFSCCPATYHTV
jgi:hypothetical protein